MNTADKANIVRDFFQGEATRYEQLGKWSKYTATKTALEMLDETTAANLYDIVHNVVTKTRPETPRCVTLPAVRWDQYRDDYRDAMLAASDDVMTNIFRDTGCPPDARVLAKSGATDADLPELFKALDAQFERNMIRAGFQRGVAYP